MLSSQSRALPHRPGDCIPPPAPLLPLQPWRGTLASSLCRKGFSLGPTPSFLPSLSSPPRGLHLPFLPEGTFWRASELWGQVTSQGKKTSSWRLHSSWRQAVASALRNQGQPLGCPGSRFPGQPSPPLPSLPRPTWKKDTLHRPRKFQLFHGVTAGSTPEGAADQSPFLLGAH